MKVEIWSDIACPWCYVGKRRFEQALQLFGSADSVEIQWRSFELDPGATSAASTADASVSQHDYADRLARKFGAGRDDALRMLDSMTATAADAGLDFHFEKAQAANTFDAHQLVHLAAAHDLGPQMKERLLKAHFTEGEAVGDRETLIRLATEIGLDPAEVRQALIDQRYASAVRTDEAEASELGVNGVPFFVIDRRFAISGAQPAEVFLDALQQAEAASRSLITVASASTATDADTACGPDGCAVV